MSVPRINWSNPLSQGMRLCVVPQASRRTPPIDLVTGRACTPAASHNINNFAPFRDAQHGSGLRSTANTAPSYDTPIIHSVAHSYLFVGAWFTGNNRGAQFATSPDCYFGFTATGLLNFTAWSGAITVTGATTVPAGKVVTGALRHKAFDHALFLNGAKDAAYSSWSGSTFVDGTVSICGLGTSGNLYATGQVGGFLWAAWDTFLSDAMLASLTLDPWQLFERNVFRTYSVPYQAPAQGSSRRRYIFIN